MPTQATVKISMEDALAIFNKSKIEKIWHKRQVSEARESLDHAIREKYSLRESLEDYIQAIRTEHEFVQTGVNITGTLIE